VTETDEDFQRLIAGLRAGDPVVLEEFCRRYGDPVERLAGRHIASGLRPRIGADDVALSVCRTFMRRMHGGEFSLDDSESLWRLLCAITLTKVRLKARHHLRQKRGVHREARAPSETSEHSTGASEPVSPATSPVDAVAFTEQFERLLSELTDEERRLVDLKLQQQTNVQIAAAMGCAERTVRRLLARLQQRFEEALEVE